VGAQGHLTQVLNALSPRTKYKRSTNIFAIKSVTFSCAHILAQLLKFLLLSLIGSHGVWAFFAKKINFWLQNLKPIEFIHSGTHWFVDRCL